MRGVRSIAKGDLGQTSAELKFIAKSEENAWLFAWQGEAGSDRGTGREHRAQCIQSENTSSNKNQAAAFLVNENPASAGFS